MKNQLLTNDSERFIDREFSLLAFQARVLQLADNADTPLLERFKFLCIVANNLDEFFEVRVAGIKEQIAAGLSKIHHMPSKDWLGQLSQTVRQLTDKQYEILQTLYPLLEQHGIVLKQKMEYTDKELLYLEQAFMQQVLPLLTPITLDVAHPFPHVPNKGLNFIIELEGKDLFGRPFNTAILPIPRNLTRLIKMPVDISNSDYSFVLLRDLITCFMHKVFTGVRVQAIHQFRITRNSHLFIDDEESKNLRLALQGELEQRNFGKAVRLEVSASCPDHLVEFLLNQYELSTMDLYRLSGPINLVRLMQLTEIIDKPELKYPTFVARYPQTWEKSKSIFERIQERDILLHHPFECFTPVVELLEAAADDESVLAIRMTIYRTGMDSLLMETLVRAAKQGKEVNVVVELMARFDEATNISWANQLEQAGAKIVYGVVGLKTHAKMLLIVRKEKAGLRYYSHLSTGNYHSKTAKQYTDFGLFTAHNGIGQEIATIFLNLSSLGRMPNLQYLWIAPFNLYTNLMAHIEREIEWAVMGKPAKIIAKMNGLLEPLVIDALYRASQAGVNIQLIVRGPCALRPKVAGLSDNIRVFSVVGRFLEHSRVYYFHHGGEELVYLSSADWMNRNLFRRIEVAIPILDQKIKKRIIREGLVNYLKDNRQSFELDGNTQHYVKRHSRGQPHFAQLSLLSP